MAIQVQLEDEQALKRWGIGLERVVEACRFCGCATRYWHLESNSPVCPGCAESVTEADLEVPRQDGSLGT